MKKIKENLDNTKCIPDRLKDAGVKVQTMAYLLGNQESIGAHVNKGDFDYGTELILTEIGSEIEQIGKDMELDEINAAKKKQK